MASLIKNQILKHLSKFTKNLSADKLQLSAMRGSCEVTNIELNEEVLMDLLELPVWMSLTRASCNFASIKIQWMKLKTIPIYILLDEVVIDVSTCEDFRQKNDNNKTGSPSLSQFQQQDMGSYGFAQKVIDGITLSINSVNIQFKSKIFSASFELTRINIESRNCFWKKVDDLSKTRIRDPLRGQVLIFKHIEWQTLRFVAKSESANAVGQAPLRLIANQASCRITLKKRLSDSQLIAARIMLIFDDLLWVLTDSQLLSALHFADYLGDLIKKAPRTKKFENNSDLIMNNNSFSRNALTQQQMKTKTLNNNHNNNVNINNKTSLMTNPVSLLFSKHDIKETSHHIIIRRIEVHLMDDLDPNSERSQCHDLKDGGALQISFHKLFIDLYPYHRTDGSSGDRNHWFRYNDPSQYRNTFITHKLNTFFRKQQAHLKNEGSKFDIEALKSHLYSLVLVIRLNDYSIGCVSTNRNGKNKTEADAKLIFYDKSSVIPGDVPPIYFEMNNYFFCEPFDKLNFNIPEPNIFGVIAPVKICFEPLTVLWINSFFANLQNALLKLQEAFPMPDNRPPQKPNIRIEILMPTLILKLSSTISKNNLDDIFVSNYDCLEIKMTKIVLFNCDSYINKDYFKNLDNLIQKLSTNIDFYYEHKQYPWFHADLKPISKEFQQKINQLFLGPNSNNSNIDADFFSIHIEPVWIEFKSIKNNLCEPFLEPINLNLWLNQKSLDDSDDDIDLNILLRIADPIRAQLTHDQFMFLIRLIEMIGDFTSQLNYDTYMIQRSQHHKIKNDTQNLSKFDREEKMIRTIFKNTALVTNIPEINLFLILKEEKVYQTPSLKSENQSTTSTMNETVSTSDNFTKMAENLTIEGEIESSIEHQTKQTAISPIQNHEEPVIIHHSETMSSLPPVLNQARGLTKSPSADLNNGSLVNIEASNKLPASKKSNSFTSVENFDSSSIKIHYTTDNEDALSTISDFSVDESDQQSMTAYANEDTHDLFDIIVDDVPIEDAVELVENMNLSIHGSDLSLENGNKFQDRTKPKVSYVDALHVQISNVNLIQQSSKGFLSQIFIDCKLNCLEELRQLNRAAYLDVVKSAAKKIEDSNKDSIETSNQLTIRIDSFSKGTLKDELISVRVEELNQSLNKETIDLIVDFLNDDITEKVAPLAILLEKIQFRIIDNSVRVPPMVFNIPRLLINRNHENRWNVEFNPLTKEMKATNHLLLQHLKIFERNLIFDIVDLIREQDRLINCNEIQNGTNETDAQQIVQEILNQKQLLITEIELLRNENQNLKKLLNGSCIK